MSKDAYRINLFKQVSQAGIVLASIFLFVACGGYGSLPSQNSSIASGSAPSGLTFSEAINRGYIATTCPPPLPGAVTCYAAHFTPLGRQVFGLPQVSAAAIQRKTASIPTPVPATNQYSLQTVLAAYGLTSLSASGGKGRIVAIVGVGNDPYVESDLAVFRSFNNLSSCTFANGCLRSVAEDGSTNLPSETAYWNSEYELDVSTVSGICPNCSILIVEASSTRLSDMATAVNTAAAMGADAIDNSYATGEGAATLQYASAYNHPGIPIVAAGGGSGPVVPASFSTVIAVGSTTLQSASNARGWADSVYWGGDGGCSTIVAKPSWQHDTGCAMRTINDIAFDADPTTTFPVYSRVGNNAPSWSPGGWPSGATVAIAAIYALAGTKVNDASDLYSASQYLTDVTTGSLGGQSDSQGGCMLPAPWTYSVVVEQSSQRRGLSSDSPAYYCMGEVGYDAPTGNGVPNGFATLTATPSPPTPISTPTATPCALPTASSPNLHPTPNPNPGSCTS